MQATPNTQAWSVSLLAECHKLVQSHLHPHLLKMFENSNYAFTEFAEKAQSSVSQIQFMDALNVVQKNRGQMEEVFQRSLDNSFSQFGNETRRFPFGLDVTRVPLTLQSKEDADIEVAIKNMTASATTSSAQELAALRQRLAVLNNGRKIEDESIPAGPACLAKAFNEAVQILELDHQTKLIVYMLFDKFVLGKLAPMYTEYNERLLKAGLLPNLKYTVRKNPNGASTTDKGRSPNSTSPQEIIAKQASASAAQSTPGTQSLGDELFGNIMKLMARRDGRSMANADANSPAVRNPLGQTEIVNAIDRVQHSAPVEGIRAEQVVAIQPGTAEHTRLVSTMSERLTDERKELFAGIDQRRMPVADTQVIDLVGMMFEYLLKDEDLPNVAKAELCRLHTPYLKIAIIDKRFFSDNTHPAHELLNALANAATRWVFEDDLERGIFPSIRNTVQRVINDFVNNIELFSELLGTFNRSLNELVDKATAIEERTKQAAAGKEKLGMARNHAAEAIQRLTSGKSVPSAIRKILGDVWLDKLMFIYLREPGAENSPSWRLAIRTIEDIIWSVEPRLTGDSQTELRVKLPVIRNRIEQAFSDLETYGTCDNKAQLDLITELQEQAFCQPADDQPAAIDAPSPAKEAADNTGDADNKQAAPLEQEEKGLPAEVQAAMETLKTIAFGTWFYIQENENSHPVRVKLSWYSRMSGNYMFVDSMGVKSTVRDYNDLAVLIADGRARIIDETKSPFVKRALVAIRRILTGD
ncbi:MAG: DUF1631 domain-containing protein [Gammaproteobacteria bacterium]|nr:DUF1631 domain-containing protein [Gammaproteobacteria bacterium]